MGRFLPVAILSTDRLVIGDSGYSEHALSVPQTHHLIDFFLTSVPSKGLHHGVCEPRTVRTILTPTLEEVTVVLSPVPNPGVAPRHTL